MVDVHHWGVSFPYTTGRRLPLGPRSLLTTHRSEVEGAYELKGRKLTFGEAWQSIQDERLRRFTLALAREDCWTRGKLGALRTQMQQGIDERPVQRFPIPGEMMSVLCVLLATSLIAFGNMMGPWATIQLGLVLLYALLVMTCMWFSLFKSLWMRERREFLVARELLATVLRQQDAAGLVVLESVTFPR